MAANSICRARELREQLTEAERLLWRHLRDRRTCGVKFRRQHPVGPFVADFCAVDQKLVVELDGGQHGLEQGRRRDSQRTAQIERRGYRVMRFWNFEVLHNLGGVLETIAGAIGARGTPSP